MLGPLSHELFLDANRLAGTIERAGVANRDRVVERLRARLEQMRCDGGRQYRLDLLVLAATALLAVESFDDQVAEPPRRRPPAVPPTIRARCLDCGATGADPTILVHDSACGDPPLLSVDPLPNGRPA